jgi:hypothetical protein
MEKAQKETDIDRGCHHDRKKLEAQAENRETRLSVCIALLKEFNSNRKDSKGYQGWGPSPLTPSGIELLGKWKG